MDARTSLMDDLPAGTIVTDPDIIEGYRRDRSSATAGRPSIVARPRTTSEVQAIMRWATETATPVVTRGAGTGLSGGATALDGCVVLSTDRMTRVHVEPAGLVVIAQPGATTGRVKADAAAAGLWYPPDPSSFESSSIGGNVATNAGGACCVKYGVTGDYVLGLEVVLADGQAVRLGRRTVKDVAGYDLKRLFVGSEGTLGVVTEVTLRLRPAPPPMATAVAVFPDVAAAGAAVAEILAVVRPATLELMDQTTVHAVEQSLHMGLDETGALLLVRTDGSVAEIDAVASACERAGASYVVRTDDPEEGEQLMHARRMALPALERLGQVMIEDVGVPVPRIPQLIAGIEAVARRHDTLIATFGHAGDGNFHPILVFDERDPAAAARAAAAFADVMALALALEGTVTGEHGVGTLKQPWLDAQLGPDAVELGRRIKRCLDPAGVLNPGRGI